MGPVRELADRPRFSLRGRREELSLGGEQQQCGWLKDRFGVTWQIIPTVLGELMQDKDPEKSRRVVQAMLQMSKIDIDTLLHAHRGEGTSKRT